MALDVLPPPSAYAVPYTGALVEVALPLNRVGIVCRLLGVERDGVVQIDGCAYRNEFSCLIIVPKVEREITQDDQNRVRGHELAHCNGWHHK